MDKKTKIKDCIARLRSKVVTYINITGPAEQMGLLGQVPVVFKIWRFLQAFRGKKNFENRTLIDLVTDELLNHAFESSQNAFTLFI